MKVNILFFASFFMFVFSSQAQTTQPTESEMKEEVIPASELESSRAISEESITGMKAAATQPTSRPSKKGMKGAATQPSPMGYQIGDKVEEFQLKSIDGKMASLSELQGDKGAIIVFTCNKCPFAKLYEQRIMELNKTMTPKGYPVIAINSNGDDGEGMDDMMAKSKEAHFNFTYLKDDQGLYKKFGARKTPEVFVLDKNHVLQYTGGIDDSANDPDQVKEQYVVNAVMAIDAGKSPDPAMTKAIGCGIKTADAKGGKPHGPPTPEMILSRMDSNGDKLISKDEAEGPLTRDFDNLDADKNGMLNVEELSAMKKKPRGPKKSN